MADEVKTTDQTTEEKEEVLFAGKYKSAEELEKAYKEAEKKMHDESQKRAEYEKKLQELEQARQEQDTEKQEEIETDLADYEYLTKKDFAREMERVIKKRDELYERKIQEQQQLFDAKMAIQEIKRNHPNLPDTEIQATVNMFPEETDFSVALTKRREHLAKVHGLYTEQPKTEKAMPPIPNQLQGTEQFGVEQEDRSRIDRMKQAGQAGSIKTKLTKK